MTSPLLTKANALSGAKKLSKAIRVLPRGAAALMKERYIAKKLLKPPDKADSEKKPISQAVDKVEQDAVAVLNYANNKSKNLVRNRNVKTPDLNKNLCGKNILLNKKELLQHFSHKANTTSKYKNLVLNKKKLQITKSQENTQFRNNSKIRHNSRIVSQNARDIPIRPNNNIKARIRHNNKNILLHKKELLKRFGNKSNRTNKNLTLSKKKFQVSRIKKMRENIRFKHNSEIRNNSRIISSNARHSSVRSNSSKIKAEGVYNKPTKQPKKQSAVIPTSNKRNAGRQPKQIFRFGDNKASNKGNPLKYYQQKAKNRATKKAQRKMAEQSLKIAKKTAKSTVKGTKKVTIALSKATAALVKSLIAILGVGGTLILLVMVIAISAVFIASPFGIYFSDEVQTADTTQLATVMSEINMEFSQKIEEIENDNTYDRIECTGSTADWAEILSVFAVKTAGADTDALDVITIDQDRIDLIRAVFWDMNEIASSVETVNNNGSSEKVLYITITAKTSDDMITDYNFSDRQAEVLEILLENRNLLTPSIQTVLITDENAAQIIANLPSDISELRSQIVANACSLVGKVNYFWGGKSSAIGWDSAWGKPMKVTASGSPSTGTTRPFGLDCSGFVTWAYINSGVPANSIGHGTYGQNANCQEITWATAQPGDLAFYTNLSHVGIVVGRDASGNVLVVHCASGANNVVITSNSGFGYVARPNILN